MSPNEAFPAQARIDVEALFESAKGFKTGYWCDIETSKSPDGERLACGKLNLRHVHGYFVGLEPLDAFRHVHQNVTFAPLSSDTPS